jgi:hypothetical protein
LNGHLLEAPREYVLLWPQSRVRLRLLLLSSISFLL